MSLLRQKAASSIARRLSATGDQRVRTHAAALLLLATTLIPTACHTQQSQLAARQALTNAPTAPRANYHRKLEPADTVLHGAGQSDEASFNAYTASLAPARPVVFMRYVDLRDDIPGFFTALRADLSKHPADLIPQIGLSLNANKAETHYEAATAEGYDDAHLTDFCTGLRSLARPTFVRIGYEFNGPWNGYTPETYVNAFRKISTALHTCSPDIAIVWDWSPDAELDRKSSPAAAAARWQSFYPGDGFVDWWALNLFRPETITSATTQAFLSEAAAHRFPVMIAESSLRGPDAINNWFAPYFGLIRSTPGIKAFCYIDWDWRQYPQWKEWGDSRIENSPAILGFYRRQIENNPLYKNSKP